MNINSEKPKYRRNRKKIINTAIKLFVKYGIQGTSMAMIADKAGVATGSLYNYFENKAALINTIFSEICEAAASAATVGGIPKGTVKERFDILMRREIAHKTKYYDHFLFMSLYAYSPIVMKEVQSGYRPEYHPMVDVFKDGRDIGLVKPLTDEDLFYFIFAGLSAWVRWKSFSEGKVSEEDIQKLIDLAWDAIEQR